MNDLGFDPNDKSLQEKIESLSDVFKEELPKGVNKLKYFKYLLYLYDPSSEIRRSVSNISQRKVLAASTAGYNLTEGRFSTEVEDCVIGKNKVATKMATEISVLLQGRDSTILNFYSSVLLELIATNSKTKETVEVIGKVKKEIDILENKILGGDDTEAFRKSLYLSSKQTTLGLQMEEIVDNLAKGGDLSEFNPYGNYKPNPIKYAGVEAPTEK